MCRGYDEVSREIRGLHTVLKHLKYEIEAPDSLLNGDSSIWGRQLAPMIGDVDSTLRQLDGMLQKYDRFIAGTPSNGVRFGSNEMDQSGNIRARIITHKTSLTVFLDKLQLHESGKMPTTLDSRDGQLDTILDKVDSIASRMNHKSGNIMITHENDDQQVWKQFRRELIAEGFSSSVLLQHKV
jgi:hypothetical protein